jgi:hypothetical protein
MTGFLSRGRDSRGLLTAGIAGAVVATLVFAAAARAAVPPQIGAAWTTEVTATSARLRAKINPEGSSTSYRFEYLTEAAYEANLNAAPPREGFFGAAKQPPGGAAPLGSGEAPVTVAQHVAGLSPLTAYRYRAVATNLGGTTHGPERVLTTQAPTNEFKLLDGRAWEMVSPVDKDGGGVGLPEAVFGGGDFQAASGGSAVAYSSAFSFAGGAGAPGASQYVSGRGENGWSTQNVTGPTLSGAYGGEPDGVPYRVFAEDLSRGLMLNGLRCAPEEACPRSYSLREGGAFAPVPGSSGLSFAGASPDLRHAVLGGEGGLYEWSGGSLQTVSATPGAALAAPLGAVSGSGQRVYFTTEAGGPLYLREIGGATKLVPETTGGGAAFQVASADGRYAFFLKAGHLRRYDATGESSTDLTPSGGVVGVLGASPDATYVYYQDGSALRRWHSGTTTQVAAGAEAAAPSDYPPALGTARVGADGAHLAFVSTAELSDFENIDASSGEPDAEVYVYGPPPGGGTPILACASCNPTGERPRGSSGIPGAVANGSTRIYKPRALSANGSRAFFESADSLAIQDTNGRPDVYEWEAKGEGDCGLAGDCVGLISSGRSGVASVFLDASAGGGDAFFLTERSLVAADPGSYDVYDARVGGGLPEPSTPIPCNGDACQPLPEAPDDPSPGSLLPNSGNPTLKIEAVKPRRHGCPKGKVKRKGKCVRKRHRRGHRRKKRTARRSGPFAKPGKVR